MTNPILSFILIGLVFLCVAVLRGRASQFQSNDGASTGGMPEAPQIRVDGKLLVVKSGAVLPQYCVLTNSALQPPDMRQETLAWSPPFTDTVLDRFALFALLGRLTKKHCLLTYGLSASVIGRRKKWRAIKIGLAFVSAVMIVVFLALGSDLIFAALIAFCSAVVLLLIDSGTTLAIVDHRNQEFWVGGCCKDFLERLKVAEASRPPAGNRSYESN